MTKKDYVKLANVLKHRRNLLDQDKQESKDEMTILIRLAELDNFACDLATMLRDDNPNFKWGAFMEAAGVMK
jgi:hypothetical protein